ncbi:MAG: hypothetical protein K2X86_16075, partial [Cytophagaceae bacterium]|nr:hypothetical protein [Cytophagaceae bacterium]
VWDAGSAKMITSLKHGYAIREIYIHPSGKYIISSSGNYYNCLWDLEQGKAVKCFSDPKTYGFTPDGKYIIVGGYGNDGKIFSTLGLISFEGSERSFFPIKFYGDSILKSVYVTADGSNFIVNEGKHIIKFNQQKPGVQEKHRIKHEHTSFAVSPDEKLIAFSGGQKVLDFHTFKELEHFENEFTDRHSLLFSPDGKKLFFLGRSDIEVMSLDSMKVMDKIALENPVVYAMSNDLNHIVYSTDGKNLFIKNIDKNEEKVSLEAGDLLARGDFKNYLKGINSFKEERYPEALFYFSKIKGDLKDKKVHWYKGRAYLYTQNYPKAIEELLKDQKQGNKRSDFDLAKAYARMDSMDKAMEYLNSYFNDPYHFAAPVEGDTCFSHFAGNEKWEKFLDAKARTQRDKLMAEVEQRKKRKDYVGALALVNKAIKSDSSNAFLYHTRAFILMEQKKYDAAIADYKKELSLDSTKIDEVYRSMAVVYARKGDYPRTSYLLKEIVEYDSSEYHLLLDISEIELMRYNTTGALTSINKYISVIEDDTEAYYMRANILNGEQAKRDINKAIGIFNAQNKPVPQKYRDFMRGL